MPGGGVPLSGTQMMFCDMGVNANPFSAYDGIVEKLVDHGIVRHQIAVMGDADTDAKMEVLVEEVRRGTVRVLTGSTSKMGTGVQWAENRAGPGKMPVLEPFRVLMGRGPQIEHGSVLRDADPKGPLSDTRIWVEDVNSDGKLDILVGDLATLLSPADKVAECELKQRFVDRNRALGDAARELNSAESDPKKQSEVQRRHQQLFDKRSELMKEDRTGFLWRYLRK